MKIQKKCKVCGRLNWFPIAKTLDQLKKDSRYTTCQRCRNFISIFKQKRDRFGRRLNATDLRALANALPEKQPLNETKALII